MHEKIYDVITVGGGPSGLICACTAVTGTPINPPRHFSGLVLDRDDIGEFAWYARLRLTHQWHLQGNQVIESLKQEARHAGLGLQDHEEVLRVTQQEKFKVVETERGRYLARKLAICTGFYPYGRLIKYPQVFRPIFGPIDWELPYIPQEKKYRMLVIGGCHTTAEVALRLSQLRPDLEVVLVLDEPTPAGAGLPAELSCYCGKVHLQQAGKKRLKLQVTAPSGQVHNLKARFALINYNSYIHRTAATDFLEGLGLQRINGYLPVDHAGNTTVEGVVAAGNIVTPVSGVLTALATGFTAGLNLYAQLYRERFGQVPVLYPWLPLDNPLEHVLLGAASSQAPEAE